MVKPEFTSQRCTIYSSWHRTIGDQYYTMDIDFVEYRDGKGIVALIETMRRTPDMLTMRKQEEVIRRIMEGDRTKCDDRGKCFEVKVYSELSKKLGIPAYLVLYDEDMRIMEIYSITDKTLVFYDSMNLVQFGDFLRGLGELEKKNQSMNGEPRSLIEENAGEVS